MVKEKKPGLLKNFLNSNKEYPVLAGVAAGLYPLIFYYSQNFTMVDSWEHLGFFLTLFVLLPIVFFKLIDWLIKRRTFGWKKYILPFLNLFVFLCLLKLVLFTGIQKKIVLGIFILAFTTAFFLHQHFKNWVIIQLILAVIGVFSLAPVMIKNLNYSEVWMQQPDNIENVVFKKKPNVYYIQPDGYANFSELGSGYYNFDNSEFETFLEQNSFKSYADFRSNYDATLASNSSIFMMKHHFYSASTGSGEVARARNIILGNNTVLKAFKNNGYTTHFFAEFPYLMMNRPTMGYDFSNFSYSEVPFLGTGLENKKEILPDLKNLWTQNNSTQPRFVFIEIFNPKHIDGSSTGENLAFKKREKYIKDLHEANITLKGIVQTILENDPDALIIIMADHGGYVGFEKLQQGNEKITDRDKIYSIFSSILSIHWPHGKAPEFYDVNLKTSVNTFRIIFSFLSENSKYLNHLEKNSSYGIINKGAPKGIYELIDENGKIVFNNMSLLKAD